MSIDTIVKHLQSAAAQDTATRRLGELVVAKGLLAKEIASAQKIAEESIPGQQEIPEAALPGLAVTVAGDGLVEHAEVEKRDRCMVIQNTQRCYLRAGHGVAHAFQQEMDPFAMRTDVGDKLVAREPFSEANGLPNKSELVTADAAANE